MRSQECRKHIQKTGKVCKLSTKTMDAVQKVLEFVEDHSEISALSTAQRRTPHINISNGENLTSTSQQQMQEEVEAQEQPASRCMDMKTNKTILIIALLALVSMMIVPVSAETLTGSVGSTGWQSVNYDFGKAGGAYWLMDYSTIRVVNIEYIVQPVSLIHFDNGTPSSYGGTWSGESSNMTIDFNMTYGTRVVATGHFGFQRTWTGFPPTEQPGFQYFSFDTWNNTGLTGTKRLTINYIGSSGSTWVDGSQAANAPPTNAPTGYFEWGCYNGGGDYVYNAGGLMTLNTNTPFLNEWTATKPSGIGIQGTVIKSVGGTIYNSQPYIFNAITHSLITSQNSVTGTAYNFSVPDETIYIAILDPYGVYHNTSDLFTSPITPTPTVTPTPTTTITPGYVRSTFVTIDGVNYNTIHGPNIMLYDIEAANWSNSTSDADGIFYIDTLPYHTINAYATYTVFANHYGDTELLGVGTGIAGMDYPIYMYPPGLDPGVGNINLYIPVVDHDTNFAIGSVSVQVELPTGAITGDITGPGGDAAVFVVPNNTVIKARASKTGYGPITESFNSGEVSPKTKTLYMHKLVVTASPTSTIPPGGVTPVVTADPRSDVKKAEDAFSKWMNILGDVTDIAIGVTIIWLMWLTVYMITGGKIIDKIMKRGRR